MFRADCRTFEIIALPKKYILSGMASTIECLLESCCKAMVNIRAPNIPNPVRYCSDAKNSIPRYNMQAGGLISMYRLMPNDVDFVCGCREPFERNCLSTCKHIGCIYSPGSDTQERIGDVTPYSIRFYPRRTLHTLIQRRKSDVVSYYGLLFLVHLTGYQSFFEEALR